MVLTVKSKGRPGLKYFGVFLKDRIKGDSTILMPVFSASTRSLPVHRKNPNQNCSKPLPVIVNLDSI